MQCVFVIACLLAVASANPGYLNAGLPYATTYAASPLAYAAPVAAPLAYAAPVAASVSSQYHAQDELGQYTYGYSGGPSSKQETRTADGITRGAYSYVDGHGIVQTTSYVADPINGFRAAATNLPVGPAAPVAVAHAAPVAIAHSAPIVHAAPAFGLASEARLVDPVAIAAGAPLPTGDTVEVAAAKAAHFQAHAVAKGHFIAKRSPGYLHTAVAAPLAYSAPVHSYGYSAYAAPIAHTYASPLVHTYANTHLIGKRSPGYLGAAAYAAPLATPLAYSAPVHSYGLSYSSPLAYSGYHGAFYG